MAYTDEGIDQRPEVLQGATDTLNYFVKANGAAATPDPASAYVTILDPGGSEKVARVAATISGSKLLRTQAWAVDDYYQQEDYIALWEWQVDGVEFSDRQYFDVVKTKLLCPIDTNDVMDLYPDVEGHLVAIGETDATKFIKRAWSMILDRIRSGGNRPSLILSKDRLKNPAIQLSAHFMCSALSRAFEDVWDLRQKRHHDFYREGMAGLGELKYDKDEDGLAATGEKQAQNRRNWSV